jgi:hypothetical protein
LLSLISFGNQLVSSSTSSFTSLLVPRTLPVVFFFFFYPRTHRLLFANRVTAGNGLALFIVMLRPHQIAFLVLLYSFLYSVQVNALPLQIRQQPTGQPTSVTTVHVTNTYVPTSDPHPGHLSPIYLTARSVHSQRHV